jgi:hypothetical protein
MITTNNTVDIPLSTFDENHSDSDSELDEPQHQPIPNTEEQIDPVSCYILKN